VGGASLDLGLYWAAWLLVATVAAAGLWRFAHGVAVRRVALTVAIGLTVWLSVWAITFARFQRVERDLLDHFTVGMTLEEAEQHLRDRGLQPHYGYGGTSFRGILVASLWPVLRPGFLHFDPVISIQFEQRTGTPRAQIVLVSKQPWLTPP
jgi:hypothetical protein